MLKYFYVILIFLSLFYYNSCTEEQNIEEQKIEEFGTINGIVKDASTDLPIQYVTVSVSGTDLKAFTDSTGKYIIKNIPATNQNITATFPGYCSNKKSVKISTNKILTVDFYLNSYSGGNTFYVSPTGDNSNPGTFSKPWATPGYAVRQLQAEDTLIILGGKYVLSQYDDDVIIPQVSGNADKWITIKGEENNKPLLAGKENLLTGIDISGKSYIKIENLELSSDQGAYFRDGIESLGGQSSYIIMKDLFIHNLDEFGINLGDVNGIQIINCEISYCGFGAVGGPAGTKGGWKNVLIDGCKFSYSGHYYQGGSGPSPYSRPDGFGIEASSGPIEIKNTIAEHNKGDGLDSKSDNTYIHHCIVANNSCDGVKLWGNNSKVENTLIYGRGDGSMEPSPWSPIVIHTEKSNCSFSIINVTVDDIVGNNYLMHVQYDHPNITLNLTIKNSIFSARGVESPIYLGKAVKFKIENNLFYMPNHEQRILQHSTKTYDSSSLNLLGNGNIYGDPLFENPAFGNNGDYHIKNGSPAIDKATDIDAPNTDLDYKLRPIGAGYDIGCYEK